MSPEPNTLIERYQAVRGSLPPHVTLVAVSKTRSVEEIKALYDLGHRAFGENYPQELRDKRSMLPPDIEWHFIGHLQRNKVKYIAPFVHLIHTVDGLELLDEIEKRAAAAGRTIGILVQVHIAQEETKHGMLADQVRALVTGWDVTRWPHVELHGLMGMATNTEDVAVVTRELAGLRALFDELSPGAVSRGIPFHTLSMGMSADAHLAVTAGSTLVRVGSALFGPRT